MNEKQLAIRVLEKCLDDICPRAPARDEYSREGEFKRAVERFEREKKNCQERLRKFSAEHKKELHELRTELDGKLQKAKRILQRSLVACGRRRDAAMAKGAQDTTAIRAKENDARATYRERTSELTTVYRQRAERTVERQAGEDIASAAHEWLCCWDGSRWVSFWLENAGLNALAYYQEAERRLSLIGIHSGRISQIIKTLNETNGDLRALKAA